MLEIYRNWDCEGAIYMKNAKTIERYRQIQDEQPDSEEHGIFWAFNNKQFDDGLEKMKERGLYKDGSTVFSIGNGGYGVSRELIDKFFDFYKDRKKRVAAECDPQEVYLYEYNNYECMIDWDGDKKAYDAIVDIYGEEIAKGITRFSNRG